MSCFGLLLWRNSGPRTMFLKSYGPKQGASGFTLLEIMVALAISAIIFTCLFSVFSRVTETAEQVDRRLKVSQDKRVILLQLIRDLDSLYLPENEEKEGPRDFSFTGQDPSEALGPDNATILEFSTASDLSFNSTRIGRGINRVKYVLNRPGQDFLGGDKQRACRACPGSNPVSRYKRNGSKPGDTLEHHDRCPNVPLCRQPRHGLTLLEYGAC